MKKKGMLISTIVMVVVLVASLTTATYAWINSTQSVSVNTIDVSIGSSARVNVGVKADPTGSDYSAYLYESVAPGAVGSGNTVTWDGGTEGLGGVLQFDGLKLNSPYAIGTTKNVDDEVNASNVKLDGVTLTNKIIKASAGASHSAVSTDAGEVSLADANRDYLHATLGIEANKTGMKGLYVKVTVTTTDQKSILGIGAALHFYIVIGGTTYDVQPFGAEGVGNGLSTTAGTTYATTKASVTAAKAIANCGYVEKDASGQLVSTFYFWVSTTAVADGFGLSGTDIKDFDIWAFVAGYDDDCRNEALGTACKIDIEFDGTDDTAKLGDGTTIGATHVFINTADSVKVGAGA